METAVTIGSYCLPQFVELCALRCRRLFGENTPILISDDLSHKSEEIKGMASRIGCAYVVGDGRFSHFGGDMQALLNAVTWGSQSDITLKISQRFIPVLHAFKDVMDKVFEDPEMLLAVPGQLSPHQIARPQAAFYRTFGILTDVIAIRSGALDAESLLNDYLGRLRNPKRHSDCFVETTIGNMLSSTFKGKHRILKEWTIHEPMRPKLYLRKAQSNASEYAKVAKMENIDGEWDLREWGQIEKGRYMPRPR